MSNQHFSHETWLSKLRDYLGNERYAAATVRQCIGVARHFLAYLKKQHVEVSAAQPANVEQYLRQTQRMCSRRRGQPSDYKHWRRSHASGIHMLLRLAQGQWPPVSVAITPAQMLEQEICQTYSQWMSGLRRLAQETVSDRCDEACRFLDWLGEPAAREKLAMLIVSDVDAYMKVRARSLCRSSLQKAAGNIRSFLRWLHMTEQTARDLSSTVIAPSLYAFESIPSALRAEDVKKILRVTQKDYTPKGIRDYAILMLLSTYGVRAGEIVALRLDDVDWRNEVVRIRHNKTEATSLLPLLPEVGEAILQYLRKSRPKTPFREMFIRSYAPYRPFKRSESLYSAVRNRIEAAGVITMGKRGPHAFRHARAVSLLRAAVPVKAIGDLLGHRSAASTLVYLKLATEDLRAVAMEIPTGLKA